MQVGEKLIETYHGKPCKRGGHTLRYRRGSACIECMKTDKANSGRDGRECIYNAKQRAKRKGVPFNITYEYMMSLWPSNGVDIFGAKMEWKGERDGKKIPRENAPSIDEIDIGKGYIKGNVMWLSKRSNQLKGGLSLDQWRHLFFVLGIPLMGGMNNEK